VGDVIMLKDTNGDGVADMVKTVASRPNMHGIAIDGRKVYLVTIKEIYVADIKDDGTFGQLQCIVDDLPDAGQHADRTLGSGRRHALCQRGLNLQCLPRGQPREREHASGQT
jgi:glucose/arabinose dehydrogenase